ncbi:MAG TPA: ATP-dependent DNA ligase [Vicinamibacterales bacterium]|jgi:DNA ligase-1|nr:ATP-dependent DNA ligase [Vicinamibacterales bacterium]
MLLHELVDTSMAVQAVSGRLDKTARLAALLTRASRDEIEIAVTFLSGGMRQGRIGLGFAAIRVAREIPAASDPSLTLEDVDRTFERIAAVSGAGSGRERAGLLRGLLARATRGEQEFLARLLFGELRQGALEGVMVDAVAKAAGVRAAVVRRAAMMAGDLAVVARVALTEGEPALAAFAVQLLRPVQPMLAESAADLDEALGEAGEFLVEQKLDGARIQVHKAGDEVRVFSRTLNEVTEAVPEVVAVVKASPGRNLILDGEVIALQRTGAPHPFQVTMRRFGRRLDVDRLRAELPLTPFFFDCLLADDTALLDEPLARRAAALAESIDAAAVVPRLVQPAPADAAAFLERTLAAGHEGVMVKTLGAPYAAGRRGAAWLKVKRARTLDLVVLAAEWGSGRRRGWLSNLHLGARDEERGGFVMLGKTFKGLTDQILAWQTREFLAREIGRDDYTVYIRPELVVEIAFNDLQESPHYPGGLALRFARVKRYRADKTAADADSFESVLQVYQQMTGLDPPARRAAQ